MSKLAAIFAEGLLDQAVAERLAKDLGQSGTPASNAGGITQFWQRIEKFNQASKHLGVIFALADHDELGCVGPKLAQRLPRKHANLVLRLSVSEVESWLLADAKALATLLSISINKVPRAPDRISDPKQALINLARRSRSQTIRTQLVPDESLGALVGPEYQRVMMDFVADAWNPSRASERSPSLARAIAALTTALSR